MHAAGLPVPPPIGARYIRHGATWSGDIIIGFIPGTETLARRISTGPVSLETWAAIGRMLSRFHAAGICHPDLNAHNVLLRDRTTACLIDFDGASVRRPGGLWADANLVRLRRSLEKLNDGPAAGRFDDAQWHCLLTAYHEATMAAAQAAAPRDGFLAP
jgi:3-deoxy-D-manno-octulosonic acid kinase